MIRVLIADDEALMRSGLQMILDLQDDIEVVAVVENGREAMEAARRKNPDVALLDIRMPDMDGLTATSAMTKLPSPPAVLVLTTFALDGNIEQALLAGAAGFLLKDTPPRELVEAIRVVMRGDAVLSPAVTRRVIELQRRQLSAHSGHSDHSKLLGRLTDREREVLPQLARGLSNADIARTLFMSEGTVKGHVSRMMDKLGVTNRVQAALIAFEAGVNDEQLGQGPVLRDDPADVAEPGER
ncbi:response regulator [Streptomyces flavofungini]|uniref:Response regulator transcription factor n=1 Tax=Streptomyces flavofungini TaxID=68200 RepID=A0ABS0XGN7_9ACTN|nr:response regulator transcription factor [Streptomyces flavofungini]MBJ3812372.1 response regulator transcription factor [Streptomyces flavofungini]GHC88152.1 DNA-binding response regulator [Streptomyces flavofungini]